MKTYDQIIAQSEEDKEVAETIVDLISLGGLAIIAIGRAIAGGFDDKATERIALAKPILQVLGEKVVVLLDVSK